MPDFTLEPEAPKKAKTDPTARELVAMFHDEFFTRFGFKPDPRQNGRLGKDFKTMLTSWSVDELKAVIQLFFRTKDPQVMRSDYSPAAFLRLAQHLRVRSVEPSRDDRTLRDAEAIQQVTRRG